MASLYEFPINYKRLSHCRKLAAQSMANFVCGESKFREVQERRAWKLYRSQA